MAVAMTAAQTRAALRKWGVPFKEYSGWASRGRPGAHGPMNGIIIHHTGSDSQSDDYLKFLFVTGRPAEGIPGPLCNVSTDMDGDLWLGAVGRANHAGRGSSATLSKVINENYEGYSSEITAGSDNTDGNAHFYGNEVRYDGGQPMTTKQYATAVRWAAAICDFHGWSALSVIGHREWSRRKPDPGKCPMNKFRSDVAALLKAGPGGNTPKPPVQEDDMPLTEAEWDRLDKLVYANESKYGAALWAAPTGTGTAFIADTEARFGALAQQNAALGSQLAGLTSAVQTLAQNQGVDPAAIVAAVTEAADRACTAALAHLEVTLKVDDDEAEAPKA